MIKERSGSFVMEQLETLQESCLSALGCLIIRNNDATELCITKGQEGFVVGWQASKGPFGKKVLDTLFVELDRPSKSVQIPGLPENVVPLSETPKQWNVSSLVI